MSYQLSSFPKTPIAIVLATVITACSSGDVNNDSSDQVSDSETQISSGSDEGDVFVAQTQDQDQDAAQMVPTESEEINTENVLAATINEATADAQLLQAIAVLNGEPLNGILEFAQRTALETQVIGRAAALGEELPEHVSVVSLSTIEDDGQGNSEHHVVYTCLNEGVVEQQLRLTEGPFSNINVSFENCEWPSPNDGSDSTVLSGSLIFSSGRRSDANIVFENFEQVSDNRNITITGNHTNPYQWVSGTESSRWENVTLDITEADNRLSLNDYQWSRSGQHHVEIPPQFLYTLDLTNNVRSIVNVDHTAVLSSSFSMTSEATGGQAITIAANLGMDTPYFDWGSDIPGLFPNYPVSDLGPTITYAFAPDIANNPVFSVDQRAAPDFFVWQDGEVLISSVDGSTAKLTFREANAVEAFIELSSSGSIETRDATEGYQINCPSVMIGCD